MAGFIDFELNGTTAEISASFQRRLDFVVPALLEKMTYLMTILQKKAQAKTKGSVAASIRDPRAEAEGTKIVGKLDWGGEPTTVQYKGGRVFDVAQILESGAKPHVINPLSTGAAGTGGAREHKKGGLKKRTGSEVLAFYSQKLNKEVFATHVFHPGVEAQHFMQSSLDEMRGEVVQGIRDTLFELKKSRF